VGGIPNDDLVVEIRCSSVSAPWLKAEGSLEYPSSLSDEDILGRLDELAQLSVVR
jgi:hypothetical protein